MYGLETNRKLNTEVTIKGILARAAERGLKLTRNEVLEELKFNDEDDTTVWSATVDRLMLEPS